MVDPKVEMTRLMLLAFLILPAAGCAHLGGLQADSRQRTALWVEAHEALEAEQFGRAEALFGNLARVHAGTLEGRESLFYLGVLRLDPRNPEWSSEPAERHLAEYLAFLEAGGPRVHRYPEAFTLHEIARQLNLPPEFRVAGLQPEERVVEERVVVPAEQSRELVAEATRLRQQVTEQDARIRQLQEELERIRRTLTAPVPR
jgi:hypothetical protein